MVPNNETQNPYAAPTTDGLESTERPARWARVEFVVDLLFVVAVAVLLLIFGWVAVALVQWAFHPASP